MSSGRQNQRRLPDADDTATAEDDKTTPSVSDVPSTSGSTTEQPDYFTYEELVEKAVEYRITQPMLEVALDTQRNVRVVGVSADNVKELEHVCDHASAFYFPKRFYPKLLIDPKLSLVAYHKAEPVGAICGRQREYKGEKFMYVNTICVLASYRERGIGWYLLMNAISLAEKTDRIKWIEIHVQTANAPIIRIAERLFFRYVRTIDYRFERFPHDGYVYRRRINQ
uniref:N-terminal methionine N(alpha)-acetyltransferase NatE n=1 Tax=Caenorhabditis tropicalis TaxID=1561998 RepID=A0A1I7TC30_9PELO